MALLSLTTIRGEARSGKTTIAAGIRDNIIANGGRVELLDEDGPNYTRKQFYQRIKNFDGHIILVGEQATQHAPNVAHLAPRWYSLKTCLLKT